MTAMTKKERLEHTRLLLRANPICRIEHEMNKNKQKRKKNPIKGTGKKRFRKGQK